MFFYLNRLNVQSFLTEETLVKPGCDLAKDLDLFAETGTRGASGPKWLLLDRFAAGISL